MDSNETLAYLTFNRTSMELKPSLARIYLAFRTAFNRTSMELKLLVDESRSCEACPFNRTSMELKPILTESSSDFSMCLLIEPVWN